MPMDLTTPVTLFGAHATLELLSPAHCPDLTEAVRDGELWNLWYTNIPRPENMEGEIARRLRLHEQGSMLPFTVRDKTGRAVGMTTFMNIDAVNRRLEIGSTWYAESVQRGPLNTECKLMLLTHAFEALDCIAVEFRTHFFNSQSRKAIERLGARRDGVLRNHSRASDGTLRDTVVYSIIQSEWPTVKSHLTWQLAKPR
jgi:N-acetyltransferase